MKLRDTDIFTRLMRTRPLFTAALFFMSGCILDRSLNLPVSFWLICTGLISIALLPLRRNRRLFCALLVVLMLPLGAIRFDLAWNTATPVAKETAVQLTGRIADDPVYDEEKQRSICLLEDVSIDGQGFRGRLRLYLRGDDALLQSVSLAQTVSCEAKLWQGDGPGNYGEFDFASWLRMNNIRGYATAKIEDAAFSAPEYALSDLNNLLCLKISDRIRRLFGENAATVKAFVLGDRSEMSISDRDSYNESGAAHLLAISGMHISVLAMLISWLFTRLFGRRSAFLLTLALLLGYGWLIGYTPSLFRAIVMFGLYHGAALSGRFSDSPTRLAAAAFIHLLISPMDVLSAGFILSYCASAGIVFLSRPLSRLFRVENLLYGSIDINPTAMLPRKIARTAVRSCVTSLAATLATFPAVIYFFGAQPLWTLLVNLVAVPLAMLSYIVSIAGVICGLSPLCFAADGLFGLLTSFIRLCAALPMASIRIARFPAWLYILCAVLVLLSSDLSALPEILRRFLPLCTLLAMFVSGGAAYLNLHEDGFIFFDAGQADCALLKTSGKVYLFDAGDSYTPAADYLSAMNFGIDGLFISHLHEDHAAGLNSILDVCVPKRIYLSANYLVSDSDEASMQALNRAQSMGCELIPLKTGDEIPLSSISFAKVLSPDAGISHSPANEDSLILHVVHGAYSALFTGDMPAESLPAKLPDVDILKVSHHGSRSSVDPRTLTELSPSVAVISVGEGNNYGHPADETTELLSASGAMVLRTDLCGAISIGFGEDSLEISTYYHFGGLK